MGQLLERCDRVRDVDLVQLGVRLEVLRDAERCCVFWHHPRIIPAGSNRWLCLILRFPETIVSSKSANHCGVMRCAAVDRGSKESRH